MTSTPSIAHIPDQQLLRERARQFVLDYPDLHGLASSVASKIMLQHTKKVFNPDKGLLASFRQRKQQSAHIYRLAAFRQTVAVDDIDRTAHAEFQCPRPGGQ
ncbi:Phosphopantothenoylcysteine synthetase/decarboxylase [Pseudomonas syringae pv. actinidiae]|uniref:Phosphopantothenoylcysteine synthetase/decarboxylase n=1 Tax=Pseudomonas syringae pv. actinidiae TaxID=103796 RepID=A0AAN4QAM5_PSESF|nr:Phosphopantothenoylcysteine synthetase/decarboxylase [Pseudomonas syringae pv. actinidiae]